MGRGPRAGRDPRRSPPTPRTRSTTAGPPIPPTPSPATRARGAGLYLGGAGVVDALRRLSERGLVELAPRLPAVPRAASSPTSRGPGLMLGETGRPARPAPPLAVGGDARAAARARRRERRTTNSASCSRAAPGRCSSRASSASTISGELGRPPARGPRPGDRACGSSTSGGKVGGATWARPTASPAACSRSATSTARPETARRYAVVEDGLANWPPVADGGLDRNGTIRVQWCHGAPGMVTSLGRRPRRGPRARRRRADLARRARPPRARASATAPPATATRSSPCSSARATSAGSSGRAGSRAHSIAQVERARADHGMGRYSLWTGDLGTALYLADCIDGAGRLPLP